jgi:hypothetical protein
VKINWRKSVREGETRSGKGGKKILFTQNGTKILFVSLFMQLINQKGCESGERKENNESERIEGIEGSMNPGNQRNRGSRGNGGNLGKRGINDTRRRKRENYLS